MTDDECAEAVKRFLARHHTAGGEEALVRWRRRIAAACNGWPQHLHNYLCGAAQALADAGGDLEHADLDNALAAGGNWRRQYYDARLEGVNADFPAVADVVAADPRVGRARRIASSNGAARRRGHRRQGATCTPG